MIRIFKHLNAFCSSDTDVGPKTYKKRKATIHVCRTVNVITKIGPHSCAKLRMI